MTDNVVLYKITCTNKMLDPTNVSFDVVMNIKEHITQYDTKCGPHLIMASVDDGKTWNEVNSMSEVRRLREKLRCY